MLLEWRQKSTLQSILLYLAGTVYICYISLTAKNGKITAPIWNALLWIIILFVTVNTVAKSFVQERSGRWLYYYTLASPQSLIVSKIIYNTLLMLLMSTSAYLLFSLVFQNPVQQPWIFFLNILIGSSGLASLYTMVSAIAVKAGQSYTLIAILGAPLSIPLLLVLMRVSMNSIDGLAWSVSQGPLLMSAALCLMISALGYILFPFLWKS
jgi:heme exporter protein B